MLRLSKNNKLIVVLCATTVFTTLIGLSIRSQSQSPPEQYIGDPVSFRQRVVSYPASFVAGMIGDFFKEGDSKGSKNKISQLESKNQRLEVENEKLKKEPDLKDISEFDPIPTTVSAENPGQRMNIIVTDKGSKSGITSNMAVMTSQGFVGRVTKVNKFSSQVDLTSTNTCAGKLSVNTQYGSKNIFDLADRYDKKNSELITSDINNRDNISKGDKVVTSGLADQLPSNLYIGEVTRVQDDQYGLAKEVKVKTGTDLTDLSHVYVTKRDSKTISDDESRDK